MNQDQKNQLEREEILLKKGDDFYKQISKQYQQTINEISDMIAAFYGRYAQKGVMSMTDANKELAMNERIALQHRIVTMQMMQDAYTQQYKTLIENIGKQPHVTRFEQLKFKIAQVLEEDAIFFKKGMTNMLSDLYKEGYLRQLFIEEMTTGNTPDKDIYKIDENKLQELLVTSWAIDGKTYSDRITQDTTTLQGKTTAELQSGFVSGASLPTVTEKTIKIIQNYGVDTQQRKSAASNLVITESSYFSGQSQFDAYTALGIERYDFLATLDEKTCERCGGAEMESERQGGFLVSERVIGVNSQPMHNKCRCTTVPRRRSEFGRRATRDPNGKTHTIRDMTYDEWRNIIHTM